MFLKKAMPALYNALGVYLPLITTNCAVLGVALTNVQKEYSIAQGVINGIGTSAGFALAIVILAGLREKMEYNDVTESFQGTPIVLSHGKPYGYRVLWILRTDIGGSRL